jgi:hypothetical protein
MADLITRLKLQNQEFNSNLNSSKKAVKDFQDQSDDASKSLKEMGDKGTAAAKSMLGEMSKIEQGGRSVSNYKSQLAQLQKQIVDLTVNYRSMNAEMQNSAQGQAIKQLLDEATERASVLKDAIGDVQDEIKNLSSDTAIWDGMKQGIQGVSGALQAFASAGILGANSQEKLVQVIAKLQAIEKTTNGVIAIGNMLQKNSAAVQAIRTLQLKLQARATGEATIAQRALNLAMKANPVGILITALTALVGLLLLFTKRSKEAFDVTKDLTKVQDDYNKKLREAQGEAGNTIGKFVSLAEQYKILKTEGEKQQWIKDNADKFNELGLKIEDVNDADDTFIENASKVIKAMQLRAQVAAAMSIYQEKYAEAYKKSLELQDKKSKTSPYGPTNEQVKSGRFKPGEDYIAHSITMPSTAGAYNQTVYEWTPEGKAKAEKLGQEAGQAYRDGVVQGMSGIIEDITAWQTEADKLESEVAGYRKARQSADNNNNNNNNNNKPEKIYKSQIKQLERQLEILEKQKWDIIEGTTTWEEHLKKINDVKNKIAELEKAEKDYIDGLNRAPRQTMELIPAIPVNSKLIGKIEPIEVPIEVKRDKIVEEFEKAKEKVNRIKGWLEVGAITKQEAIKLVNQVNKELADKKITAKVSLDIEEEEVKTFADSLRDITERADGWIGAADGIVGSFSRIYDSISSIGEKFEDTEDPIKRFFMLFETGIGILQSITTVINAVATVTELLNKAKEKSIGELILEAAAHKKNAGAALEDAGANAAGAVAGGAKSVADIPVVGWVLAGVAAATLLALLLSSMASAKKFAGGGIVGGNSYSGDKILAGLNSGEMVLNQDQQNKLFRMINEGPASGGTGGQVEFKIRGTELVGVLGNVNRKNSMI